jgi:hypothetical protein
MKIPCACRACGFVNDAEWSQIGQWIACWGCGTTLVVPAPMETIGEAEPPKAVVKFRCPACNRKFATKPELAGKKIRCTGCGAGVRVPESGPTYWSADDEPAPPPPVHSLAPEVATPIYSRAAEVPAPPQPPLGRAPEVATPIYSRIAEVPAQTQPPLGRIAAPGAPRPGGAPGPMQPAPSRAPEAAVPRSTAAHEVADSSPPLADLASLDGIKVPKRAGTVLSSRSEMMEQVRQQADEETVAAQEKAEKTKKKKKKRRKHSGYFDPKETLQLVAGVGALVVVLALAAWRYPDFRFPLGGFLCVVGFIVYLLGITSLRQHVAEEGAFKALLFRFFPPYQWWYIATRWEETRDFVAFFGAGMLILSLGSAIIKTSAVGKRAEAADRAYQKARQGDQREIAPLPPVVGPPRTGARADVPPPSPKAVAGDDD